MGKEGRGKEGKGSGSGRGGEGGARLPYPLVGVASEVVGQGTLGCLGRLE